MPGGSRKAEHQYLGGLGHGEHAGESRKAEHQYLGGLGHGEHARREQES